MDLSRLILGRVHARPPAHDDIEWKGGAVLGLEGHPLPGDRIVDVKGKNFVADYSCGRQSVETLMSFGFRPGFCLWYRLV